MHVGMPMASSQIWPIGHDPPKLFQTMQGVEERVISRKHT